MFSIRRLCELNRVAGLFLLLSLGAAPGIRAQTADSFEDDDTVATAAEIGNDVTLPDLTIFPAGDPDHFRVFAGPGMIDVSAVASNPAMSLTLDVFDSNGTLLDSATGSSPMVSATAASLGFYFIRVVENTSTPGGYALSVQAPDSGLVCTGPPAVPLGSDGFEENDTITTAAEIAPQTCLANLTIFPSGDPDYFRFFAGPGGVEVAAFASNPLMSLTLQLFDSNGTLLDGATGTSPAVTVTAPVSGLYFILVDESSGTPGAYRLSVRASTSPLPVPVTSHSGILLIVTALVLSAARGFARQRREYLGRCRRWDQRH